ncbi:protein takeout-like [Hyposmocoma kahamanoa]|uniref:protein takeout-like n=1 Tax=Hyposmocoma kahamanoa TaxID=1477025 RepID=UPI000E6D9F24|nr:protein takeout-like [Hyposmocoma kahamanoa]
MVDGGNRSSGDMRGLLVLVVFGVSCRWANAGLAPYITPCHASDSECLKTSAQKAVPFLAPGIPELGMKSLDPMHIELVRADQAGLKVEFRKTVVKGLRNCVILSMKRHGKKQSIELKCSVVLVGDYTIGGRLLILPVEGEGKYRIKIRDLIVTVKYDVGEKIMDGDVYWTLPKWTHSTELQGGAEFQFQNLFNGNKQLSDAVHQFANQNWKDIFQEVAPPIVREIVTAIVLEVSKFFTKVPLKELALD